MSQKNLDRKGRWRCRTVVFHVSPEEWEEIRTRAKLSGLTLQEYVTRRCQEQDVVSVGNPRVYKALKTQMQQILSALESIAKGGGGLRRTAGDHPICDPDFRRHERRLMPQAHSKAKN